MQQAARATAAVKPKTRQSGATETSMARPFTKSASNLLLNQLAVVNPTALPTSASTRLSVRHWRINRPRPAPMAGRMEISR